MVCQGVNKISQQLYGLMIHVWILFAEKAKVVKRSTTDGGVVLSAHRPLKDAMTGSALKMSPHQDCKRKPKRILSFIYS